MCLGIPGRIEAIEDSTATVSFGTVKREVDVRLLENVKVGDYVLVHAGFAINKLSEKDAQETLGLLREMMSLEDDLHSKVE